MQTFSRHMLTVFLSVIYRNPCEKQSEFSYSRVNFNNLTVLYYNFDRNINVLEQQVYLSYILNLYEQ